MGQQRRGQRRLRQDAPLAGTRAAAAPAACSSSTPKAARSSAPAPPAGRARWPRTRSCSPPRPRSPASGPTSRIPTKVFADGRIDADGVLHGSLYLQGGGDPTLGTPAFYDSYLGGLGTNIFALGPQISAAGITAVTGRLYADDTIFDRLRGVADSGYATSSDIGPLSGLDFNSGFAGRSSSSGFSSDPAKLAAAEARPARCTRPGSRIPTTVALGKTPAGRETGRDRPLADRSTQIVNTTDVYSTTSSPRC